MSYYLLCSDVCSLGHCVASWTSSFPGSICDVAVRYYPNRCPPFGTWASAFHVLNPVLLHAHDGLVTFPCLWRRGSFPHSLPFYETDTASTLTASWSRWSLVTSVSVALGFGILLDWPTTTSLHVAVLGARVWNEESSQSLGFHSGIVRCIQARSCFVHVHICSPSPHSMRWWLRVSVLSHFLHVSVCHACPEESYICGKDIVNYLKPCRFCDFRNRCIPRVFPYCRPVCLWPLVGDPHLLEFCCRPTHAVHSVVQSSLIIWLRFCTPLCHIRHVHRIPM